VHWVAGGEVCNAMYRCLVITAGVLEYQAQSPDEGALVNAARNFGFVFRVCSLTVSQEEVDWI